MRYGILGGAEAWRDGGEAVGLAGGRLRALLTALALRPGRVVPADALIEDVWDGDPPAGAAGALQALVGRLRRAIGHDALDSVEGGYRLVAERDDIDLYRFERLADEGARALADGDPVKASGLLADALGLWRGPALADLPDPGPTAVRADALRDDTRRQRLAAELELGRAAHVLPELAELAAGHPLDEPLHALHIRALRAAGRTADALTAYETVRRALAEELGADPSPELRALHAELLNPGPEQAAPVRPPGPRPRRLAPRHGNARTRLTSFVGREAEIAAVGADLGRARLVTITGPGGTGKTRLSQEAGDLVADRWADGVWYAELAPVSDPRTLPEAVISSLGLRDTQLHGLTSEAMAVENKNKDPLHRLADHLAGRELLLVLDNCEHVIDAAATLAERLLADCPGVAVLATSREPLGVPGELVRPLDPLPDPVALRLLADRGAAARPGFSVDDDPVACAELCHRLDGLPLAIELAAARLRSLSPRGLADRLDDRFRLLTGGSRTLLPRQQTLRAVVDWSWDLLDPAERTLLRRLAVFRGGWTLEAVEAICADPAAEDPAPRAPHTTEPGTAGPDTTEPGTAAPGTAAPAAPHTARIHPADAAPLLASLVDKSLVLAEFTADGERYRMLETIYEYSAERLGQSGERPAVERRHLTYFREFARTANPKLRRAGQLAWFERLERDHENLQAALRRAVDLGDEDEALLLVLSCTWFWEVRNYVSERRHWPALVAAMGPDPFHVPPYLEPLEHGPLDGRPPLTEVQRVEARRWVRVVQMSAAEGDTEWWNDPGMVELGRAMLASYPSHLPQSARFPGILRPYAAFLTGDFDQLRVLVDETVESCRRHHQDWELAFSLQMRAKVNNDVTEYVPTAVRDIAESRRIFERLGDEWGMAETLSAEAEAAGNAGDWAHAAECCRKGIALARKIGSHQHVPVLTVRLGDALINAGEVDRGMAALHEGIEDATRFGGDSVGAHFYGKILLSAAYTHTGRPRDALELIEETIREGAEGSGQPGFVLGMLLGIKGYLVGILGAPLQGLALIEEGQGVLGGHPLANVITPRLGILLAPGAAELLSLLAESEVKAAARTAAAQGTGPGPLDPAGPAARRARRAAALVNASDRLRPSAMPPAEVRSLHRTKDRLHRVLGADGYRAAYAEGDGLTLGEAVALMRDVD
ncbi:ATP-binding protein [Actinacidiphila epipremni]|uniref:AfsR/SARP family transcriptional regulator n=1 Tax=Actinacidiphila epipremni TaxID=2053013 RepID=A0ABX0ZN59_9ACTN|nr:BTAD domain-containing putative transcriptional regulator [Actinacidiphila epipremni]NJP44691.1 AfsR/SARP family transcriptional regulator [Actinacidiphila epipremni]